MTDFRLDRRRGEVVDRDRPISFTWNGSPIDGLAGDTIVSALSASGVRVLGRSFKYHRPRGLLTASYHDPNAMVQVGEDPNVRAGHRRVIDGMDVRSQNTWPSLAFDVKEANRLVGRFLTPGFYYKTFMAPRRLWPLYQRVLGRFAAGGTVHRGRRAERFDHRYAHPDVLVAGGGPAGMAAAIAAADAGASVMLVEEEPELGGHLRWSGPGSIGRLEALRSAVAKRASIEVLTDAVVTGRYDHNWISVVARDVPGVTERLIKARAKTFVVSVGTLERPYVFAGNDVPGVMLSTAAMRLVNLYAVRPGFAAVVLSANAEGDATAGVLRDVGVDVTVLDARRGVTVVEAEGRSSVRAVTDSTGRRHHVDLLVTATGWTAPTALLNMAGDRPIYDSAAARFVPGQLPNEVLATGGIVGDGDLDAILDHADATGREAARRAAGVRATWQRAAPAGAPADQPPPDPVAVPMLRPAEHPELFRSSTHGFVDFSEDVTSKDLISAAHEGYDSMELAKRYTTAGMGPVQGKIAAVNALAAHNEGIGATLGDTQTTTWRPPYAPVRLSTLAGRNHEPVRYSPMQPWHEAHGAQPLVAGQWIRPEHYGDPEAEVRAVREGVGIIDVSPIGKIDLRGTDVPKLLEFVYTNRWSKLAVGKVRYGVMCTDEGVIFDDGVTGRLADERWMMSTTSGGAGRVWNWLDDWLQTGFPHWDVRMTAVTDGWASINVAGPNSRELVGRLTDIDLDPAAFGYMEVRTGRVADVDGCFVWRIGFTGELSYEIHVPSAHGLWAWERLLEVGADLGVRPFGIEAQRVLRLEKGHFIVGQDTDGLTLAHGNGVDWAIRLDKDDFAGKAEIGWQPERDGQTVLVPVETVDPFLVPPEASQIIDAAGSIVGRITSSRMSPTIQRSIALARVARGLDAPGTALVIRLPDRSDARAVVADGHAWVDPEGGRMRV